MKSGLTLENFKNLAKKGKRVSVYKEFPADRITPVIAYQALSSLGDGSVLLESGEFDPAIGRYSYMGFRPILELRYSSGKSEIKHRGALSSTTQNPFEVLKDLIKHNSCVADHDLPPLVGGAVGYMSYDAIRLFEKIPDRHPNQADIPDLMFQFHDLSIIFKHQNETMIISLIVEVSDNPESDYQKALAEIQRIAKAIFEYKVPAERSGTLAGEVQVDIPDEEFCKMVEQAKEYVKAGDAFQIVLSRCFRRPYSGTPLELYRALRFVNPSPYMFLINDRNVSFVGASPELLVSVHGGIMETMPIAGTRPRGKGMDDVRLEKELLADKKEIAEHMMLVDLARNDLGSVAIPGSVALNQFKTVQRYSHVMHIVSRVHGTLKEGYTMLDALRAVFPAGTLSGAPKIRAMEIIDELETSKRNLYGGAVCAIDAKGNMESCIAIRMAALQNGEALVRAGAGIVYDSVPEKEADETRHKAKGILEAVRLAQEGLI